MGSPIYQSPRCDRTQTNRSIQTKTHHSADETKREPPPTPETRRHRPLRLAKSLGLVAQSSAHTKLSGIDRFASNGGLTPENGSGASVRIMRLLDLHGYIVNNTILEIRRHAKWAKIDSANELTVLCSEKLVGRIGPTNCR